MLGEVGVAGPAARDRGQQVLVVAVADADRRRTDARRLRSVRETLELIVVGHALVREAVGEQHQGGPVAVGDALGLLDAAQEASREVRHAARVDRSQCVADVLAAGHRGGGDGYGDLIVERHEAESVLRRQMSDKTVDGLQCGQQSIAGHRTASVDDELKGRRRALGGLVSGGRGQLEERVNGLLVLDRDEVKVELRVEFHDCLVAGGGAFLTRAKRQAVPRP